MEYTFWTVFDLPLARIEKAHTEIDKLKIINNIDKHGGFT